MQPLALLRTMTTMSVAVLLVGSALSVSPAAGAAAGRWEVRAPSGGVSTEVSLTDDGRLELSVRTGGAELLRAADLGVVTPAADLTAGLSFRDRRDRSVRESYTMTTGKQRTRTVDARETRLRFAGSGGAELTLVLRVSDDGVAYRYELPGGGPVTVDRESGGFLLPADATSWLQPYNSYHEAEHAQATAATAPTGEYSHTALFGVGDAYVLLAESGLDGRYAGARLTHTAGSGRYDVQLDGQRPVTSPGPLATGWRTMIVGDLATVTESTLVDDLAAPARFADTSWIRPGLSSWSWLAEHASPRDFERQKDFVDAAAVNGFGYVLVDEGWEAAWVPELTRYARAKGVDVLVWFHWTNLETQEQRDAWLPRLVSWGVKGVKVDFMESDSQQRYQWYDDILADTAEHRLMVNFHGSAVPHGLSRTWPHLMTQEGVRGEENGLNPVRNTILPFTRNVIGSMDYTPTRFATAANPKPETTNAHELALPVVYESAWTHVVSTPEELAAHPVGARYLSQLPTTWDETRLLSGAPGTDAVFARRSGDRWFVGGIRSGTGGDVDVPLAFLGKGRWLVETVTDDGDALALSTAVRGSSDRLTIPTRDRGGFAIVACPAAPGRSTCHQAVRQAPGTTVLVDADKSTLQVGDTVTVQGIFAVRTGGPAKDVTLAAEVPTGWTLVSGKAVRADRLRDGETVSGRWTLRLEPGGVRGDIDLVVGASYTAPGGRTIYSADAATVLAEPDPPTGAAYVSDLPWTDESNGFGRPQQRDLSHSGERPPGPLTIAGTVYPKGIGAHAPSSLTTWLGTACATFHAEVGVDDNTGIPEGSVTFVVSGDGRELARTPVIRSGQAAVPLTVDVTGVKRLTLATTDGGDGRNNDLADWGIARLSCT